MRKLRVPSPAMAVALVSLFVALSGTAFAVGEGIVPLAKRAYSADNAKHALTADRAKKLGATSSAALVQQAVSQAAQAPGPASTAAGLVVVKSATWSAHPGTGGDFTVVCDAGQKAVSGGWEDPVGWGHSWDSRPTSDDSGWHTYISVSSNAPGGQSGTVYAVCVK